MKEIVELEGCLKAQLETFFKMDLFQLKIAKEHYEQLSIKKAALQEPIQAPTNHRYKAEKGLRRAALSYGYQINVLQARRSQILRSLDQLFDITAKDTEVINNTYPSTQKIMKESISEPNQAQLAAPASESEALQNPPAEETEKKLDAENIDQKFQSREAPGSGRPSTGTLNRCSVLQQSSSAAPSSVDSDARRVPQRSSSHRGRSERRCRFECLERRECGQRDRFDRRKAGDKRGLVRSDQNRPSVTKRGYSKETEDRSHERRHCGPADPLPRVASMTDHRDQGTRGKAGSEETVKREAVSTPPPAPAKATLSEDGMDKKSKVIIEEFLHINDMKEALHCVQELNLEPLLFVFVRNGIESSLERSSIERERMGLLLYQLLKAGTLPSEQYNKGLQEILEVAEDMAIDIPYIWQYLAEIIAPMLHEGGIAMGELFKEVSKPLIPLGKAGILLAKILSLLCKGMSHEKAGALWKDAELVWKDILPEGDDVNKFVTSFKK